jgi:hypothetical protein
VKNDYISTSNLSKIYFASSGCFGECPIIQIEVDSNLNYSFHGVMFTKKQGYYTGKIEYPIFKAFRKYIDSSVIVPIDVRRKRLFTADAQFYRLILFKKDGKIYNSDSLRVDYDLYRILMNSYKYIKLEKADTIKFYGEPLI